MKCARCNLSVDGKWLYCPKCGNQLKRRRTILDVFSNFNKEVGSMDRMLEKGFETLDLSPFFGRPSRGRGFRIKITRRDINSPKVSVQSFGDVNRDAMRDQLKRQLGIEEGPIKIQIGPPKKPVGLPVKETPRNDLPTPKTTEEPVTDVRTTDRGVVVDMELPGVKSMEDVRIREMDESIEVRAVAGDKGFFKIFTKPGQSKITSKSLSNGKLHLEFS